MIIPKNIFIIVNGKRCSIDKFPALKLKVTQKHFSCNSAAIFDLQLINHGPEPVKIDAVELRFDNTSFWGNKTDSYRFYKEGLTVVGVSGARGDDDCDFELDPGFLRFTVSDADKYSWKQKNIFCGEQVGLVNNKQTGENILFGFITAKDYFCRIIMNMAEKADIHVSAVIDNDGTIIESGNDINLEKMMIASGNDVEKLLKDYAAETALHMNAIPASKIPTS